MVLSPPHISQIVPRKRRHTLAVLLLVACALLAIISAAQDVVIDRQKSLILQLSIDSQELFAIRARQIRERNAEKAADTAPTPKPAHKPYKPAKEGCLLPGVCA